VASMPIGGSLAAQAQSSLLQSREDHMLHQLNSVKAGNDDAKIDKSAQEFESMLLSTWLQQAEQSMASVPGADDQDDQSGGLKDQMMSLGVQSLSTAMAASGGIGIGKMIAHALHAAAAHRQEAEAQASKSVTSGTSGAAEAPGIVK
jgi:Rod binding domain-containing protein